MPSAPTATPDPRRYGRTAIVLHWLLAAMILASIVVGLYMTRIPLSPWRLTLYNWHKWAGVTILVLSGLRLLWRLAHRPPEPPAMPRWQARAAAASHALMYALFFAVPISGWAYSSSVGFPVVLFGVLPLPDFVAQSRETAAIVKPLHQALAYTLAATIVLHVAAALKHHFVDRDGLLSRMWPCKSLGTRRSIA